MLDESLSGRSGEDAHAERLPAAAAGQEAPALDYAEDALTLIVPCREAAFIAKSGETYAIGFDARGKSPQCDDVVRRHLLNEVRPVALKIDAPEAQIVLTEAQVRFGFGEYLPTVVFVAAFLVLLTVCLLLFRRG